MSQIGYMFMAVGVGGYANGMFHLMTHAFFKATLFMGAGLVIHALAGEQDIRKMGGIGKVMPWTRWMFLAASLALAGIFPFAGFFSKDPIIASTLNIGWYGYVFWACGIVGAFLTGLYTFRLYFLVFPGKPSTFVEEHHHDHHGHEGPWTMLIPVAVLTALSIFGGWIQFEPLWHLVTDWLEPVAPTLPIAVPTNTQEWLTSSRRRALRHRRCICDLRHRAARDPAAAGRAARARAQALLRRGVRRNLLQAGRRLLDVAAEGCGGSVPPRRSA
jgi:NADH-quinone oxidoreductase subunit L